MAVTDLTAIILTKNEEKHISRCLESLSGVASRIFVVDAYSSDNTVQIAKSMGAVVVQRPWKNYADQFQWAIDNADVRSGWLMRMDADEYLEPDLRAELPRLLKMLPDDVLGVYVKRKVHFYGKWIRHGGFYPHILLRIWRAGYGRIEQRWMDEHIVLPPGAKTVLAKGHIVDDNLKGITFWIDKHNKYASREAVDLLNLKYPLFPQDETLKFTEDPQAKLKRLLKEGLYARLPIGLRAALYFLYRYIFRLGFLDGSKGFIWHFLQGFWYRLLVDVKVMELEMRSKGDVEILRRLLREEHGLDI